MDECPYKPFLKDGAEALVFSPDLHPLCQVPTMVLRAASTRQHPQLHVTRPIYFIFWMKFTVLAQPCTETACPHCDPILCPSKFLTGNSKGQRGKMGQCLISGEQDNMNFLLCRALADAGAPQKHPLAQNTEDLPTKQQEKRSKRLQKVEGTQVLVVPACRVRPILSTGIHYSLNATAAAAAPEGAPQ